MASIVRSGSKTQKVMSSEEFRDVFSKNWIRILPKPACLRFDDEGAFRDLQTIDWLEGQAMQVSVIAGEAAWQMGKHSRHIEVLKENMTLLSLELGESVRAEELLGLSLAAKNELHQVSGYSPNQWAFGQERNRVQSFLQHGNNLPTQSLREQETFESSLQRMELARHGFLKADARRRILRAARGRARKAETFQTGQLVYFYRKGLKSSRYEGGWRGPARVIAVEKHGDSEANQTSGSVVWIVHGTILYRCAPEQLRFVPKTVSETYQELHGQTTSFEEVRSLGNRANYRDISQDLAEEPEDSELHDAEPDPASEHPVPARRVFGKTAPGHGNRQEGAPRQAHEGSQQDQRGRESSSSSRRDRALPRAHAQTAGPRTDGGRQICQQDSERGTPGPLLRDLDRGTPNGEHPIHQPHPVCGQNGRRDEAGTERDEFWRNAEAVREADRSRRVGSDGPRIRSHQSGANASNDRGAARELHVPQEPGRPAGAQSPATAGDAVSGISEHRRGSGEDRRASQQAHDDRGRGSEREQVSRSRSRTPFGQAPSRIFHAEGQGREEEIGLDAIVEGAEEDYPIKAVLVDCDPEVSVGNALDLSNGNLGSRKQGDDRSEVVQLGCFAWQRPADEAWEAVPKAKQLGAVSRSKEGRDELTCLSYFATALQEQTEVFEIALDIQPRDVHKMKSQGKSQWVLNDKPKKRAEVSFRHLQDSLIVTSWIS